MEEIIYEPREDSYLLQKYVEMYSKGSVLDMGTGSGIQAITASKKAKEVVAVDINPEAVKQTKLALEIEKIKNVKVLQSDLFQ
ncbi:MAG: 50S ribosomal protein L11 methyltransferase, partial [Nanoarchaeota archaeon]